MTKIYSTEDIQDLDYRSFYRLLIRCPEGFRPETDFIRNKYESYYDSIHIDSYEFYPGTYAHISVNCIFRAQIHGNAKSIGRLEMKFGHDFMGENNDVSVHTPLCPSIDESLIRQFYDSVVGKEKPVPIVDANVNDDGPGFSQVRPRN